MLFSINISNKKKRCRFMLKPCAYDVRIVDF